MSNKYDQWQIEVTLPTDSDGHYRTIKSRIESRYGIENRYSTRKRDLMADSLMTYISRPMPTQQAMSGAQQLRDALVSLYDDRSVSEVKGPSGPYMNTEWPRLSIDVSEFTDSQIETRKSTESWRREVKKAERLGETEP